MIILRNILVLLVCEIVICFLIVSLSPAVVHAVPYHPVITYNGIDYDVYTDYDITPVAPAEPPNGYITGYVLNEEGRPVEGAIVSVLQDGQLWRFDMYGYYPGKSNYQTRNPDWTRIGYDDDEGFVKAGGFMFGLPIPDTYTIVAEKDGYTGSATVRVGSEILNMSDRSNRSITLNITLKGYHKQSLFSAKRLSYTGAIVGDIWNDTGGKTAARISIYQDGQLLDEPYNPQFAIGRNGSGKHIDYRFMHLAPGHYTVIVDSPEGNGTVSVDVGTDIMRADIVVSKDTSPVYSPRQGFMPTVGPYFAPNKDTSAELQTVAATEAKPTPAMVWWATPLILTITASVVIWKRHRQ